MTESLGQSVDLTGSFISRWSFETTDSQLEAYWPDSGRRASISFGPVFVLSTRNGEFISAPGHIPRNQLLEELGQDLDTVTMLDDGRLRIRTLGGTVIEVAPQFDYEAWQVEAHGTLAIAPSPGDPPEVFSGPARGLGS